MTLRIYAALRSLNEIPKILIPIDIIYLNYTKYCKIISI